jgi:hypothetical protein
VMASLPQGVPLFVKREKHSESYLAKAKKLLAKNMMDACAPQGIGPSVPWLYKAATTGKIPIHQYLEDTIPPGQWGRLAEVGAVEGQMGKLRVIGKKSYWDTSLPPVRSSLWALPICPKDSHLAATNNQYHYLNDEALLDARRLPRIGYANVKPKDREVALHPKGNRDKRAWREEDASEKLTSDSDSVSSASGDDEKEHKSAAPNKPPTPPKEPILRFEEDFALCKPGSFCVGLAESSVGPSPYIFVGLIIAVAEAKDNKDYHQVTMHDFRCTADPWDKECLDKPWHRSKAKTVQVRPHYSVMSYVKKLNSNGKLPKSVKDAVAERESTIQWHL